MNESFQGNKTSLNHEKSLMFKYGRMQRKIPPQIVCCSYGACLNCMLPEVKLPLGRDFLAFKSLSDSENCNSLL